MQPRTGLTQPRLTNSPVKRSDPAPIRLMLADDHKMLREGLRRSMVERGFDVIGEARDGAEAVELAASLRPDVILMDVSMPEMNGREATIAIRDYESKAGRARTPIIGVTAHALKGDMESCFEVGMDVSMPEIDGVEATRQIRERQPDVRIVMLTMHADQDVLADAIRAGANGYLVKDCSTDEIASAIETVAGGETALSPRLAASMLAEVRRQEDQAEQTRIITKREEEVLQHIADGCSTPEVAENLYISQKTVKNHLASIYQKLDARDRTQAVLQAVRMGIVTLD